MKRDTLFKILGSGSERSALWRWNETRASLSYSSPRQQKPKRRAIMEIVTTNGSGAMAGTNDAVTTKNKTEETIVTDAHDTVKRRNELRRVRRACKAQGWLLPSIVVDGQRSYRAVPLHQLQPIDIHALAIELGVADLDECRRHFQRESLLKEMMSADEGRAITAFIAFRQMRQKGGKGNG
jgi:hypothetical protein